MEETSNTIGKTLSLETEIDILKYIHQEQWNEVNYRRDREYRIFTWSTSILFALMAVLLVTKETQDVVWKPYGYWGNIIASLAVGVLVLFCILWQFRTTKFRAQNTEVVHRIGRLLHCFDEGFFDDKENQALYPKIWDIPEPEKISYLKRLLFDANYASATLYVGILTIAMIWIRS